MAITSLMVAPRDNNDNNKRRKKERRTGGKTQEEMYKRQPLKSWKRPPLSVKGEGEEEGNSYRVFTELKTLGLIWSDREEEEDEEEEEERKKERERERAAESEKGKRKERERRKGRRGQDICSSRSSRDAADTR
ncbi:Uncharacterized protein DBV15_03868 [Temnothorax longispinosus]|uniref:Uncharacterized protein n=1 Tax=Temnothorax longispinosus TaxID=300112 RepID=A0A4S2JT50_9HYME|nr:Uncharacterized protein DBV15_03868 [Temnothorax longispinosus]